MSELQIALLSIGLVAIVAVYGFGWWQQRLYRRRFGAAFKASHADALYHDDSRRTRPGRRAGRSVAAQVRLWQTGTGMRHETGRAWVGTRHRREPHPLSALSYRPATGGPWRRDQRGETGGFQRSGAGCSQAYQGSDHRPGYPWDISACDGTGRVLRRG